MAQQSSSNQADDTMRRGLGLLRLLINLGLFFTGFQISSQLPFLLMVPVSALGISQKSAKRSRRR